TGDRTAERAGPPERHVCRRKRRRHCRSPARQGRRAGRRGGAVRGHVQTLLHARPRGHHRRTGRRTSEAFTAVGETGGALAGRSLDAIPWLAPIVLPPPLTPPSERAV